MSAAFLRELVLRCDARVARIGRVARFRTGTANLRRDPSATATADDRPGRIVDCRWPTADRRRVGSTLPLRWPDAHGRLALVRITWRQLHHRRATLAAELARAPRPATDPNAQGIGAQADDGASTHGRVRGTAQGRAPLRAPALMDLFDTTQLGLRARHRGAAHAPERARRQPREREHARLPPQGRRLPRRAAGGLRDRRPRTRSRAPASRPRRRPTSCADGNGVDIDVESANDGQERPRVRGARQVARGAHRHPPVRDGDVADGPLRRDRHLRQRPQRRAPAHGRHGREPRQRADHARRRRRPVPAQGGRRSRRPATAASAARWPRPARAAAARRAACRSPGSSRTRRPNRLVYDPGHPDADAAGLRLDAERQPGHRDGRPDHLRRAPTRRTSPPCRRPSRCSRRRWTSCADADRSQHSPSSGAEWSVGSVGGVDDASSTGAAGAASGSGFGGMLAKQIGQLDSIQQDAATASQQLATGQATDPSARSSWRSSAPACRCSSPPRSAPRPSRPSRTSSTRRSSPPHLTPFPMPFRSLLANTTPKGKVVMAASALAVLAVMLVMFKVASAPSYTTMLTGLDPAETGKITAALDANGINYEIAEQRHRARGRQGADRAGAHRARREGPPRQGPARLRALRQAEARRQRLPAEGHLPARARGRDRLDDRADPGRLRRAGPARAARGPALRRGPDAGHGGRPAQRLGDELDPGAVRGIAQLVSSTRQGPQADERLDHRRDRHAAVAERGRQRGDGGGATKQAAEARYDTQLEAQPRRDARPDARPRQGPACRSRADLNVDQTTIDKLTYGKKGVAAQDDGRDREAQRGSGGASGGAAGTREQPARATPTRGAAGRQLELQAQDDEDGLRRRQDRPAHEGRARAGQQPERRAGGRQVRPAGAGRRSSRAPCRPPPASTRRAATRSPSARSRSPSRGDRRPAAGPAGDVIELRQVRRASASACSCFLFFVTRHLQAARGRGARRADLAARDRGADDARRARGRPRDPDGRPRRRDARPERDAPSAEELAERQPERVAQQVRAWMQED